MSARPLHRPNLHMLCTALLALAASSAAAAAAAAGQSLNDPTRPPASLMAPQSAPQAAGAPQLQSVLIGRHPGGRHVAVIDGHTLRLGERYQGALLERVSETEVVLLKGTQRTVLKLYAPAPRTDQPSDKPSATSGAAGMAK